MQYQRKKVWLPLQTNSILAIFLLFAFNQLIKQKKRNYKSLQLRELDVSPDFIFTST